MNRDMREDGAAQARVLKNAYERDDADAVIAAMLTLAKRLMLNGYVLWPDDRQALPILIEGRLPTPEEFVDMSATDSHGRHDPNQLHATAKLMKRERAKVSAGLGNCPRCANMLAFADEIDRRRLVAEFKLRDFEATHSASVKIGELASVQEERDLFRGLLYDIVTNHVANIGTESQFVCFGGVEIPCRTVRNPSWARWEKARIALGIGPETFIERPEAANWKPYNATSQVRKGSE